MQYDFRSIVLTALFPSIVFYYNKFSRINWIECPGTVVSYLGMHLLQGQYCFPSTTFLIIPYNVVWNWVWDNILRISPWYFNLICHNGKLQIGWDSVMRMSADKRELFLYEAFLYFNPLLLAVSFSSHYFSFCVCMHTWIYTFISSLHSSLYHCVSSHFYVPGFDGLALGNQLMGFCSGWS